MVGEKIEFTDSAGTIVQISITGFTDAQNVTGTLSAAIANTNARDTFKEQVFPQEKVLLVLLRFMISV